jgi:DNA-binding helix-hairpin-helix protein with protein kinase domain
VSNLKVFDGLNNPIALGAELGRGGEGTVYGLVDRIDLVAKIYHHPSDPALADKLRAMVALNTDSLLKIAAWPVQTLHQQPGGVVTGLLMPKVTDYKPIHFLYGPKTRLAEFPSATFPFLVHATTNLARAFAVIHAHKQVVGDVNESNIRVSQQGMVKFIDCDSFQITTNSRQYLCEVGVPTHQPPEMLVRPSFHGVVRTANHDCFGLAVLVFQLLMMGRHPFAGRYLSSGEMSLDKAIQEGRFAYGGKSTSRRMKPPPNTLPLEVLSSPIATLFECAFTANSVAGSIRPSAEEWLTTLEVFTKNLRVCNRNPTHSYLTSLSSCPLCDVEARAGILLFAFIRVTPIPGMSPSRLSTIWLDIGAIRSPGPAPQLQSQSQSSVPVTVSVSAKRSGRIRRTRNVLAVTVVLLGAIVSMVNGTLWALIVAVVVGCVVADLRNSGRAKAKRARDQAYAQWEELEKRWKQEAGDIEFQKKRRELDSAHDELSDIPNKRSNRLRELEGKCRETAYRRFLEQHLVASAKISNIGLGRKATLRSYGIETAADVTHAAIIAVPGFGYGLTANMLQWRKSIEQAFVFDPKKGIDPSDIAALDREFQATRVRLEQLISGGAVQLRAVVRNVEEKRKVLRPEIDRAMETYASLDAEWRAL